MKSSSCLPDFHEMGTLETRSKVLSVFHEEKNNASFSQMSLFFLLNKHYFNCFVFVFLGGGSRK